MKISNVKWIRLTEATGELQRRECREEAQLISGAKCAKLRLNIWKWNQANWQLNLLQN